MSASALTRVASDIQAATGRSGADFGILSRLEDLGHGMLVHHELATSLGWQKAARPATAIRHHLLEHLDAGEAQILVDVVRRMEGK